MDMYGSLDFSKSVGKLIRPSLDISSGLPLDGRSGEFCFAHNRGWLCVGVGSNNLPAWIPITQEISMYQHAQPDTALEWTINHGLQASLVTVQIFDLNGKQIGADEIDCSLYNVTTIRFSSPQAGFALVQLGTRVGEPKLQVAYSQNFQYLSTWTVTHGLGRTPTIDCVIDNHVVAPLDITYPNANTAVVTWSSPQTGYVLCT